MVYNLLSFSPLALIGMMLSIKLPLLTMWGLILVLQQVSALLYFYPLSIVFIGSFSLLGFVIVQQLQAEWIITLSEAFINFRLNMGNYIAGYDLLDATNSLLALILIAIIFSLLCLVIVYRLKHDQFIATGILLYMIYGWYNYYDSAYAYIILYVSTYLLLHILKKFNSVASNSDIVKVRGVDVLFGEWLHISYRYLFIILFIAFLLPKGNNLVEWQWLENQLTTVFPSLIDLRQEAENTRTFSSADLFDFGQTGFISDEGLLGGPVQLNHTTAFVVDAPSPLYLRGNILTIYDGKSWQHGNRLKIEEDTGVALRPELLTGESITVTITNKNLSSFTLFAPYQPLAVTIERPGKLWIDVNHQITLLGARYKDESYSINSFLPSETQDSVTSPSSILFNKEDYLELPATLPSRVKDLALAVSATGETAKEKADLITTYLRSTYTYTLDVPPLPFGEDFVDYFLFDSKEGYCTYFASSLSILLRSIDIPTRYVEGFRMPEEKTNTHYDVLFSNGHAWVEAYFHTSGWVTLEATPAFLAPVPPENLETLTRASDINLYDIEDEAAYLLAFKQNQLRDVSFSDKESEQQRTQKDRHSSALITLKKIPSLLLLLLVIVGFLRVVYMDRTYKKYYNSLPNSSEKGVYIYANIIELLEHLNAKRDPGETTREFSKRIKRQLYDFDHDFELITALYLEIKYSELKINDHNYNTLIEFYQFSEHRVRYKIGLVNFFHKKYIVGNLITLYASQSRFMHL